jgi:hypothetical protein
MLRRKSIAAGELCRGALGFATERQEQVGESLGRFNLGAVANSLK